MILWPRENGNSTVMGLLLLTTETTTKTKSSSTFGWDTTFFFLHNFTAIFPISHLLLFLCDFCLILVHLVLRLGGLNNYNFYHDVNRGGLMRDVRDCDNTTTILKRARL